MTTGWLVLALVSVLMLGCTPKPYLGERRDLHGQMMPQQDTVPMAPELGETPGALGPEAPYLPLVQPPEVRRAWITAHLNDSGDLVAGHWVYLMLKPSSWLLRSYVHKAMPERLELALPPPPMTPPRDNPEAAAPPQ